MTDKKLPHRPPWKKDMMFDPKAPPPADQNCSTCIYFGLQQVTCHRYPPGQSGMPDAWPVVKPDDWCGEWAYQ